MTRSVVRAAVAVALPALLFVAPAHAGARARQCAFAKQRAAVEAADAQLACRRQAERNNTTVDPACTAAADAAMVAAFQQAEQIGGCKPAGDAGLIVQFVDEFAATIGRELQGRCQAKGATCGDADPPCCTGLKCASRIGGGATCG